MTRSNALRMRLAVAALAALGVAGAALAQTPAATKTVADPEGRFTFETPRSWPVDTETSPSGRTAVLAGVDPECQFHAMADPNNAMATPQAIQRSMTAPIGTAKWQEQMTAFRGPLFDDRTAAIVISEESVDTTGFFPIQKAKATVGAQTVTAAIYPRPGLIVWSFCRGWKPVDSSAVFAAVQSSFKATRDEAMIAEAAAAAAAPTAPAPPAKKQ